MKIKREIVICEYCKGKGYTVNHEVTNYHKGEYEAIKLDCISCDSKGRVVQITTVAFEHLK
jgi:hypothetical protein